MPLYLRSVNAERQSYNGFQWPSEIGATVVTPDWSPSPCCGQGLHGLLWGQGSINLLNLTDDAIFQVVEYDGPDAIDLTGKYKFPSCVLRYEGDRYAAAAYLAAYAPANLTIPFLTATAGYGGTATAGDRGTATAGGYGTATAGDHGTATAGYGGTATAGNRGTATAGDYGIATAGDHGTATAGDYGTATAGASGTATAGDYGIVQIAYHSVSRKRIATAYVGENGIKPNTLYCLNSDNKFVAAE